jgi:hypothetical protein
MGSGSSYDLETPTAIMGVRGTLFMVRTDAAGSVYLDVLEGAVETESNGEPSQGSGSLLIPEGNALRVTDSGIRPEGQKEVDLGELITGQSPEVLVYMLNDMVERSEDLAKAVDEAKKTFDKSGEQESAKQVLALNAQLQSLTQLAGRFLAEVSGSSQKEEFDKELEKGNQKVEDIKDLLTEKQKKSKDTKEEVVQKAQNTGINTEDILPAADVKLQGGGNANSAGNGNSGSNGNSNGNSNNGGNGNSGSNGNSVGTATAEGIGIRVLTVIPAGIVTAAETGTQEATVTPVGTATAEATGTQEATVTPVGAKMAAVKINRNLYWLTPALCLFLQMQGFIIVIINSLMSNMYLGVFCKFDYYQMSRPKLYIQLIPV